MTAACATFTTTHRVIDRVHNYAAVVGATTEPAAAACLTGGFQGVFAVAHDANGGLAGSEHFAGFAGREFDDGVVAFARNELGEGAGAACHEGTLAGTEFDSVDERPDGDAGERKCVADFRSGFGTGHYGGADFQAVGGDDIGFAAVNVVEKSDAAER